MMRATRMLAVLALLHSGMGQAKAGYVNLDQLDVTIGGVTHQYLGYSPGVSYSIHGPILVTGLGDVAVNSLRSVKRRGRFGTAAENEL